MINESVAEEIEYFQSLSYDDKLQYFDKERISFKKETHFFNSSYELFITIKPRNHTELKKYNKWVIDHWRESFHDDLITSKSVFLHQPFKYFSELKDYFNRKTLGLTRVNQVEFIDKQIDLIGRLVKTFRIERELVVFIHECFQDNLEEDLYSFKYEISNTLTKLKKIGMLWDAIKYRVFLRKEKQSIQKIKIVAKGYSITPLSVQAITKIYDALVEKQFIHHSSNKHNFIEIFSGKDTGSHEKIRWIDKVNAEVNKTTLISFVDGLVGEEDEQQSYFIKQYFVVYQLIKNGGAGKREEIQLDTEKIKQTKKAMKKKIKLSVRQLLVKEIAKIALTI
ncbi:hypothetical protein ACUN24_16370 [Pedobacter sp. WC2501]|uniref:hypothetical protein n=1 Tax=Pedobacter sp. WC2501 TaxID=3461400 RepID=UPI00404561CD